MKIFKSIFPILAIASMISGCTSMKSVVINVEKPAILTMPENINYLTIVNNTAVQPSNMDHYILTGVRNKIKNNTEVSCDSVGQIFCKLFSENLKSKNFFDGIELYEYSLRPDNNYNQVNKIDSVDRIELCRITDSDGLISLDKFAIKSELTPLVMLTESFFQKMLLVEAKCAINIYNYKGKQIADQINFSDTLIWVENYTDDLVLTDSLPSTEDAAKSIAAYLADKISVAFAPYWEPQVRWYFYDSGKNMKKAQKKIDSNEWDSAIDLWKESFEQEKNEKRKGRLAYNLAFGHEMTDKIIDAAYWIGQSIKIFADNNENSIDEQNLKKAQDYQQLISLRYVDFKVLDKQLRISE